jgi:O-antigen/teichoic acid export membrane protein
VLVIFCGLGLNTSMARFIPELQVQQNKAGLVRLIRTTCGWEALSLVACTALVFIAKPALDRYFFGAGTADFPGGTTTLLWAVLFFVAARAFRNYLDVVMTSLYCVAATAVQSAVQGLLLVGLLFVALSPTNMRLAGVALSAQSVALLLVSVYGAWWLKRYLSRLEWQGESSRPIGSRRLFSLGWASLLNQSGQLIMQRYSEVVFLSASAPAAMVGIYDLGVGQTQMFLTLLPFAVHGLFTTAVSESYARDPNCLGRLIRTYYKVLILVLLPMSAFGAFFSSEIFALFFPSPGNQAGMVASWFFVIHLLGFLSVPLSMAIVAKEKVLAMIPLLYMTIVVNLVLDYLLIPRYEIYGATAAVILTFVVTIPIRLYVARKVIGGIYFPVSFFLRHSAVLFGSAWALSQLASPIGSLFEPWLGRFANLPAITLLGLVFVAIYFGAMRWLRLFTHEDAVEFRKLNVSALDRVLNIVAGRLAD